MTSLKYIEREEGKNCESKSSASLSSKEIESAIQIQILNEITCISLRAKSLGENINPSVLSTPIYV